MKDSTRTLAYVGVALVSVVVAIFAAPRIQDPSEEDNLGKQFYPDFDDPSIATALEVVMFDEETAQIRRFSVQKKDGDWIIPSHNNYPADAADRLSNTATSLVGIKRGERRSRSVDDYEDLGVIDPLDQKSQRIKGLGDRLTLKADDEVLIDLIIGKPVSGRTGFYYVRKPQEKTTYVANLQIDLSTKFADWVETDLLKLNRDDLIEVVIDKYSIDEVQGKIIKGERNVVTREQSADPWLLDGLDEEKEEMNTTDINAMLSALDDLKLIGVRKKPDGLSAALKKEKGGPLNRAELQQRGFFLSPDSRLLANDGELLGLTSKGVLYVLRFGQIFTGSDLELEAGIETGSKKPAKKSDEDADAKQGRFLFVTAQLSERGLGPKPVLPQKPSAAEPAEPPAKAEANESDPKEGDDGDGEGGDDPEPKDTDPEDNKDTDNKDEEPKEPKKDLEKEYQDQLKLYKLELKTWEAKVKDAKKEVEDLNRRFADWYYVISEESFKKLSLSRAELVKEKEKPADETPTDPFPGTPAPGEPGAEAPKPSAEKKTDDEKEEAPKADESEKKEPPKDEPADEKKESEPKPDAPKPDGPKPGDAKTDE